MMMGVVSSDLFLRYLLENYLNIIIIMSVSCDSITVVSLSDFSNRGKVSEQKPLNINTEIQK